MGTGLVWHSSMLSRAPTEGALQSRIAKSAEPGLRLRFPPFRSPTRTLRSWRVPVRIEENERGADCRPVLILNKLLILVDAQNYKDPGDAVSAHVLHTRGLRRVGFVSGRSDPSGFAGDLNHREIRPS